MWAVGNFVWYVLFTPLQPTTDGLLSTAWKAITSTNVLFLVRENPIFIISLIVVIIMGILAQWQVNRAQDKTRKVESELKEAEARAKRDIEKVYESSNESLESERNRFEQEINLLRANGLNAIQENNEFWDKRVKSERNEHRAEITDLVLRKAESRIISNIFNG